MGRKCCVVGCHSNYDLSTAKNSKLKQKNDNTKEAHRKIKMFGLPIAVHGVQRGSRSPQRKVGPSKMLRPPKTSAMAGPPNYRPPQRNWIPSSPHHFLCAILFPDDHSLKFIYHKLTRTQKDNKGCSCLLISSGMKNWKTWEMKISGAISCRSQLSPRKGKVPPRHRGPP